MRTKMLIATAAACAVGIATSVAQVYSVNAVGYVNVTVSENVANPLGVTYVLVSNPLKTGGNTLAEVFPSVPDLTGFFAFNNTTGVFDSQKTYLGGWDDPSYVFDNGVGGFLAFDNGFIDGTVTVTFVGEVLQGTLNVGVPNNAYVIIGSKVPQAGQIDTALGFPARDFDQCFTWNRATWQYKSAATYLGGWDDPALATVEVAAGFVIAPDLTPPVPPARTWTRAFNVNNP
jgi:hypothetical protein